MTATAAPPAGAVVDETLDRFTARLDAERADGKTVGVVLTMGALHRGHASLIRRAADDCDVVAVTVFVNPTQFSEATDLAAYPRTIEADVEAAHGAGAHMVFAPSVPEMYPDWPSPPATTVSVPGLSARWEGASRPGHFDGVASVVVKLLAAAGRCRSYFGEKDFQQLVVVRRAVGDLSLPARIIGCPTVREPDGLALSSRNTRLVGEERPAASCLYRALCAGADVVEAGGATTEVERAMADAVAVEPLVALDYAVVVDAHDLEPAGDDIERPLRLLIAATVGSVRLIDNLDPRRTR